MKKSEHWKRKSMKKVKKYIIWKTICAHNLKK